MSNDVKCFFLKLFGLMSRAVAFFGTREGQKQWHHRWRSLTFSYGLSDVLGLTRGCLVCKNLGLRGALQLHNFSTFVHDVFNPFFRHLNGLHQFQHVSTCSCIVTNFQFLLVQILRTGSSEDPGLLAEKRKRKLKN